LEFILRINAQFLTQYRGGTEKDAKVIDRFAWATVEVDIYEYSARTFTPVFRPNSGKPEECVFHDGTSYWADADEIASRHRGYVGYIDDCYWQGKKLPGLKNFQSAEQRRSSWNSFGFNFFERYPVRHAFTIWPDNLKNYRPGGRVEWDETYIIGNRYSTYLHDNFACVEGRILCRIERPCFAPRQYKWEDIRIFTPLGGHGDAVIDFVPAYAASFDKAETAKAGWEWLISPSELEDLDRSSVDPRSRSVRALFMDLFRNTSWISGQKTITRSKAAKKLLALHDVWKSQGSSIEPGHLDDVAEILQTIAEPATAGNILDSWGNRPICL
jgi:hypothetical protein